jgi:hypothetical protein
MGRGELNSVGIAGIPADIRIPALPIAVVIFLTWHEVGIIKNNIITVS